MPADLSSAQTADRARLYWVDWLRFGAALAVVLDHTRAFYFLGFDRYSGFEHPAARAVFISLFSLGRQAVAVFFVLSGWLVGGNAIRKVRAGTFDAAAYTADRFSRVYVPLIPALLLTLAILRVIESPIKPKEFAACFVSWQGVGAVKAPGGNAPLWTLSFEVWFYVLAGGAAVAFRRASMPWQRLAGGAVAAFAAWVCVELSWAYLVCWLIGAAGYWLRDRIRPAGRPWTAAGGLLFMAAGTVIYQLNEDVLPPVPPAVDEWLPPSEVAQWMVSAGALALIASLVSAAPRSRAGRWIEWAGTPLAAFSYTLYLTHYPVIVALRTDLGPVKPKWTFGSVTHAVSWVVICLAVALVMYALFERQTPRARRWLRAKLASAAPPENRLPTAEGERLAPAR